MYVPVIHSANYDQQYFIQAVVNIIAEFGRPEGPPSGAP